VETTFGALTFLGAFVAFSASTFDAETATVGVWTAGTVTCSFSVDLEFLTFGILLYYI
jgi:hypothetical protein